LDTPTTIPTIAVACRRRKLIVIKSRDIIWLGEWYFKPSDATDPLLEPYEDEFEYTDASYEWDNMESVFPDFNHKVMFANAVDQNPNTNASEVPAASGIPTPSFSAPVTSIMKTTKSGRAVKPVDRMILADIESGGISAAELNLTMMN
jgi:hypothetical protein